MQTDDGQKMLHGLGKGAGTAGSGLLVVRDGIYACDDCVQAIANDDYTGLDYWCSGAEERNARMAQIQAGIGRLAKDGYLVVGEEVGFTHAGCGVCLDGLGGNKHEVKVLSAPRDSGEVTHG